MSRSKSEKTSIDTYPFPSFPPFLLSSFSPFPPLLPPPHVCLLPKLKLSEHMTSPPGYLSESELISLMEKHSIGTVRCMAIISPPFTLTHLSLLTSEQDASISVHIENICSRSYVKVDSGRRLIPTKLGVVLVHGYQKVCDSDTFVDSSDRPH